MIVPLKADKDELTGRYVDTTEANFSKTMLISCYSLTALAQRAEKLMTETRRHEDVDYAALASKIEKELARLRVGKKYRKLPT